MKKHKYDICPGCGGKKTEISRQCKECFSAGKHNTVGRARVRRETEV